MATERMVGSGDRWKSKNDNSNKTRNTRNRRVRGTKTPKGQRGDVRCCAAKDAKAKANERRTKKKDEALGYKRRRGSSGFGRKKKVRRRVYDCWPAEGGGWLVGRSANSPCSPCRCRTEQTRNTRERPGISQGSRARWRSGAGGRQPMCLVGSASGCAAAANASCWLRGSVLGPGKVSWQAIIPHDPREVWLANPG